MTHDPGSSSVEPRTDERRTDELRRTQQQRQRFFIAFAMIEGTVLAVAVVLIYVLEVIDPAMGHWVLIAIALLGGGLLSTYLMISTRRSQRELEESTRA